MFAKQKVLHLILYNNFAQYLHGTNFDDFQTTTHHKELQKEMKIEEG